MTRVIKDKWAFSPLEKQIIKKSLALYAGFLVGKPTGKELEDVYKIIRKIIE